MIYILRVLVDLEGDFMVGIYDNEVELLCTLWSFKNLDEYKELFSDSNPYFYVNRIYK